MTISSKTALPKTQIYGSFRWGASPSEHIDQINKNKALGLKFGMWF